MNIVDALQQTGALDSITRELGIDPSVAQSGAAALVPALVGGFKNQAQPGLGGIDNLAGILGSGGGLLDALNSSGPTPSQPGNDILGQIFGSKDVSRTVAGHASQSTGIDPAILKKMLPLLAMAVAGYMAKQKAGNAGSGGGGLLDQVLGSVLGGGQSTASAGGLGGLSSLIDLDGDGNPLNDILGMAAKLGRS